MQEAHDPYGALRQRDYRRLLAGNVLFTLGSGMQTVAVGWELWQRTGNPAALGISGLVQFVPVLMLALPAGQAADRYNRKKLLMVAQCLSLCTSVGLAALSFFEGPVELIYICLFMVGVARSFNVPARWALLPQVIPPEMLANAVTWNTSGFHVANVAGPALGGWVIYQALPYHAYLLTAFLVLCCVGLISTLQPRHVPKPKEPRTLKTLLAGIKFVWQTKPILATITLDLFAVLLGGATALLPIYATDILQVGPRGLGWLRAADALGALVMALIMAHRPPIRQMGKTLVIAVAGFGLATIFFGISESFPLSLALLLIVGAMDNISVVVRGTLVQTLTPEAMRGRVGAVNIVFVSSSNELGGFESGLTAYYFGAVASVVMGGIGTILVVLTVIALWPAILRLSLNPQPFVSVEEDPSTIEETLAPPV